MALFAAHIWTYWIAPFLVAGVVLLFVGLGVGYLVKVVRPQYPPSELPIPEALRRR